MTSGHGCTWIVVCGADFRVLSGWWHASALFWKIWLSKVGCTCACRQESPAFVHIQNPYAAVCCAAILYSNWLSSRSVTDSLLARSGVLFQTEEFLNQIIQPVLFPQCLISRVTKCAQKFMTIGHSRAVFKQQMPYRWGILSFRAALVLYTA